ncbi:MAG: serine hydrolase [Coxiella endosymbiont of Dermacentor nuttalli]
MKYNLPGAILSICKTENCIRHYCAGYADVETHESLSAEHIFQSGEITRMFTAALILKRVEEGVLDLDSPLAVLSNHHRLDGGRLKLIVDLYPYLKPVTLRALLNNTSGLPSYDRTVTYQKAFSDKPHKVWQAEDYLDLITGSNVRYRLGYVLPVRGVFSDSATNYIIAGLVLEASTGRKSSLQMQELFNSIGLRSTYYCPYGVLEKDLLPKLAHGYLPVSHLYASSFSHRKLVTYNNDCELKVYDVTDAYNFNGLAGTASLSNTNDLIYWMRMLLEGRILNGSLKQLFNGVPVDIKTSSREDQDFYGLGIYKTKSRQSGDVIWSAGNNLGYGMLVAHIIERNITFALSVNISRKIINFHEPTLVVPIFQKLFKAIQGKKRPKKYYNSESI